MKNTWKVALSIAFCMLWLAGCGKDEPVQPDTTTQTKQTANKDGVELTASTDGSLQTSPPAESAQEKAAEQVDESTLVGSIDDMRSRAQAASQESRLFEPAKDNAFLWHVLIIEQDPEEVLSSNALLDMFPYAIMHAEEAIGDGKIEKARRVMDLMRRANPNAPALPRLESDLENKIAALAKAKEDEERRLAEEEQRQEALAAQKEKDAEAARLAAEQQTAAPEPTEPAAPTPEPTQETAPAPVNLVIARSVQPEMPARAEREGISGSVTVQFTVQPDGSISNPVVTRATPSGYFDAAAINAVRQFRFQPIPRPTQGSQTFNFTPTASANQSATGRKPASSGASPKLQVVKQVAPKMPKRAMRQGISGKATVEFTVGANGSVTDAKVVNSRPGNVFDRAALDAIKQFQFQPPGEPTTGRQTFEFKP